MISVPAGTRLIILDLDSTLAVLPIDWEGMKRALAETFADVAFAQLSVGLRSAWRRYGADGRRRGFAVIREFEQASVPALKGVPDVLDLVHTHRGRVVFAICSNNLHATIEDVVQALGLEGVFSLFIGRDDVEEGKPAPEGLLRILRELQIRPDDALFIGDQESDARAGACAGIRTIVIDRARAGRRRTLSPEAASSREGRRRGAHGRVRRPGIVNLKDR